MEEKWSAIRSSLTKSAEAVLSTERRYHPDWFIESAASLEPMLQHRNHLYAKWLATGRSADLQRFRKVRGDACRAVREAKNSWFHVMAEEAQRGRFGGKEVWRCFRALKSGRRGLRPITRCTSIRDEEGNLCDSQSAKHQQWQRYFTQVLNVHSQFDSE